VEQSVERQDAPARYWINGNKRHNSDCRYYGNTKDRYYTDEKVGEACGICGGGQADDLGSLKKSLYIVKHPRLDYTI